jgi:plastocyanin
MNIRSGLSILGLAAALACGGGGGGSSYSPPPPSGPPANTVWIGGAGSYGGGGATTFDPSTLTVAAGTTVTFSWQGGTHTLTSYAYNGSPVFPGVPMPGQSSGTYTYKFNTAGTYYYYCEYHGTLVAGGASIATGMAGKVVVN